MSAPEKSLSAKTPAECPSDKPLKKEKKIKTFLKNLRRGLPMKIVIFSFSAGAICVFPFLVLQMLQLGITIKEVALLNLLSPISSLSGPIVAGLVADKTGKFSLVLLVNMAIAALFGNLLLLVPQVEKDVVSITCNPDSTLALKFDLCPECIYEIGSEKTTMTVENCRPCEDSEDTSNSSYITHMSTSYECPEISSDYEMTLNFTSPHPTTNNSCSLDLFHIAQQNLSYGPLPAINKRRFCDYQCDIKVPTKYCESEGYIFSRNFKIYGVLYIISHFFFAASFTMMDASLLAYTKEYNLKLGRQRIMIMLGFSFSPVLAGVLIDAYTERTGQLSYAPAFLLADVFFACAVLVLSRIELLGDINESNIFKDLGKLVSRIEVDAFLFIILILGCNFGFIETYLFVYLMSIGAPSILLGLTMTIGCLASIPMLFYSEWLQEKIGRMNIFLLCFTAYAGRMFGYSFTNHPWMCLIYESLEAFTYQLMWVTSLKLCPLLAPKGLLATMTGVTGAIHYSFGKGFGGFFGAFLIDAFGIKIAFRIFGCIALSGGIIYAIIHKTILKKKIILRERELKEEKLKEIEAELFNAEETREYRRRSEDPCSDLHNSLTCLTGTGTFSNSKAGNLNENGTIPTGDIRHRLNRNDFNKSVPSLEEPVESDLVFSKSMGALNP